VEDRDWTRVVWYGLMGSWFLYQVAARRRLRQKAIRSGEDA
jgi:hypothetical protein